MVEEPIELTRAGLNRLSEEVRAPRGGPGTAGWNAQSSHTRRFNATLIDAYRRHGGQVPGELSAIDILLLTATGAKSGKPRTVPVDAHHIDDRLVIVASMGGADRHPPWFLNVSANPEVEVELGTEHFRATAVVTAGEDRDRLFAQVVEQVPVFGEYQRRTSRTLPVVELRRHLRDPVTATPRSRAQPRADARPEPVCGVQRLGR
jgi:deazaflavin-dependent oxidoreductase (nitroreductase family)